jgi:O-methyltransferase
MLGRDWPAQALTMVGMKRLDNLQFCVESIIRDKVAGDLVETGVWRGGASIFMRAALEAYGDTERRVWCADSFAGLPPPDTERYVQDKDVTWHLSKELAVSLETVQANFRAFDLLDERVKFLVGWFKDTLPSAPISAVSVLRLDGDMYESTMDALSALYAKVSPLGFVIVDDYGITEPLVDIDGFAVYWRRAA